MVTFIPWGIELGSLLGLPFAWLWVNRAESKRRT